MSQPSFKLRRVRPGDVPAVGEIYNYYVTHSTCTFATQPEGPDYWQRWLVEHDDAHPAIVAVDGERVVGWGSLSPWNSRCAYRFSVEDSIYVHPDHHRRGIGRALLKELIALAARCGHRNVIAQIADHQVASESLHAAFGFRRVGCLERVGRKFDRWIDVVIWQKPLDGAAPGDDRAK